MDLARVHRPGQYLIKACFRFSSETVAVVLFSTGGINMRSRPMGDRIAKNKKWLVPVEDLSRIFSDLSVHKH